MSTVHRTAPALSPQETIARDLILERTRARRREGRPLRRHVRSAVLLRRLAARLDPVEAGAPTSDAWTGYSPRYS